MVATIEPLYPPLSHQLVALTAKLTGDIYLAYKIILLLFLIIGPIAVFRYARRITTRDSSLIAGLLFIILPSIRMMVFTYGQFAAFVSIIFILLCAGPFYDFIRSRNKYAGIEAICWISCSVASHHATTFFFLPAVLTIVIFSNIHRKNLNSHLTNSFLLLTLTIIFSYIVVYSFWNWFFGFQIQTPIPHPSRENLLIDFNIFRFFFLYFYGPVLLILPFLLMKSILRSNFLISVCLIEFYLVLGLGGTTPVPSIIFGNNWNWMTFERLMYGEQF